eukprot:TRINITY_DN70895_c0_g1_i1.p1 TRINITY_DN70895_c0_g1~~TRINITY_DN70895_c0_g1_i1.p1  ORF type:complete len:112 (-),score=17.16 TRINITY_DN70895_c0_g1_i1:62-364(-)
MAAETAKPELEPTPYMGTPHITQYLGQHPFHPYDPAMPADHPCAAENAQFGQCMKEQPADLDLHLKHVNCYLGKPPLMVCLTRYRRHQREKAEKLAAQKA